MNNLNRYLVSLVSTFMAEDSEHAVEQFMDMIANSDVVPNNVQLLCQQEGCYHKPSHHRDTPEASCRYCNCESLWIEV